MNSPRQITPPTPDYAADASAAIAAADARSGNRPLWSSRCRSRTPALPTDAASRAAIVVRVAVDAAIGPVSVTFLPHHPHYYFHGDRSAPFTSPLPFYRQLRLTATDRIRIWSNNAGRKGRNNRRPPSAHVVYHHRRGAATSPLSPSHKFDDNITAVPIFPRGRSPSLLPTGYRRCYTTLRTSSSGRKAPKNR